MKKALVLCLLSGWLTSAWAYVSASSTDAQIDSVYRQRLDKLARQLHVCRPVLRRDDYQLRIWERAALMYGDAQKLYILDKRGSRVCLNVYSMQYDEAQLKGFRREVRRKKVNGELWQQLVQQDVLTLADMTSFWNQQKKNQSPKRDTTSRMEVDSTGSIHITPKRYKNNHFMISDGTGFSFQVYGKEYYHDYGYANPLEYARAYPEAADLQKAGVILYRLFQALHQ